ncbi:hypothetical protein F5I97DRAFT_1886666 [Phlebopus sp. FC_14]|nr:hypothetical protein F5I97DRAFT_1886666 [Phlebopus sp. FC_14]
MVGSYGSPLNIPPWGEVSLKDVTYGDLGLPHRVSNERTAGRLFELLYSNLGSEPKSYTASFPPALLFAIRELLRQDLAPLPGDSRDVLLLPNVLSKLRSWRLLDRPLRHSFETLQKLAIDLAEISRPDFSFQTSDGGDQSPSRPARLRIKWAGAGLSAASSYEGDRSSFEFRTALPNPALKSGQLESRELHVGGTVHNVSRRGLLCVAHSAGAEVTQDDPTVGFRSGCSACRQPRVSLPSTPPTPLLPMNSASCDSTCDEHVVTPRSVPSKPKPTPQKRAKVKVSKIPTLVPRKREIDENEPPVRSPTNAKPGVVFPRRTVPLANAPVAAATSVASAASSHRGSAGGVLQRSPISNIDHKNIEIRRGNVNRRAASNDLRPTAPVIYASGSDLRGRPSRAESFSRRPIPPSGPTPNSKMPKSISNRTLSNSSTDPELTLPPAIISRSVKARTPPPSTPRTSDEVIQPHKLTGGHVSTVRSSIPQPMNTGIARHDLCLSSPRKTSRGSFTTPIFPLTRNW